MSQRDKNMVMIGADQINNTINESAITTETLKQRQQQQSNATTASQNNDRLFHWSR